MFFTQAKPDMCSCKKENAYEYYQREERKLSGDVARLRASTMSPFMESVNILLSWQHFRFGMMFWKVIRPPTICGMNSSLSKPGHSTRTTFLPESSWILNWIFNSFDGAGCMIKIWLGDKNAVKVLKMCVCL